MLPSNYSFKISTRVEASNGSIVYVDLSSVIPLALDALLGIIFIAR